MDGVLLPHRNKYPRWCDQCIHPSIGLHRKARLIWRRPGYPDVFLCLKHANELTE